MDIDLVLHELREQCGEVFARRDYLAGLGEPGPVERRLIELAEKFDALDQWLARGGKAPDAWRETEDHR